MDQLLKRARKRIALVTPAFMVGFVLLVWELMPPLPLINTLMISVSVAIVYVSLRVLLTFGSRLERLGVDGGMVCVAIIVAFSFALFLWTGVAYESFFWAVLGFISAEGMVLIFKVLDVFNRTRLAKA